MTTGSFLSYRAIIPVRVQLFPLALIVACAGCAGPGGPRAALHLAPIANSTVANSNRAAPVARAQPWWRDGNDRLLARLIERGLADDAAPPCRADAIVPVSQGARSPAVRTPTIRTRLIRLLVPRKDPADRLADAYAQAQRRGALAAQIALAYVEVRRWQERMAARIKALDPARDNAEIAHFRREAGLVGALDGELADVMTGLDASAVDNARSHFGDAVAHLSHLTGATPDDLIAQLGAEGQVPELTAHPEMTDLSHRADLRALDLRLSAGLAHGHVTQAAIDAAWQAKPAAADATRSAPATAVARWKAAETRARADLNQAAGALAAATAQLDLLDQTETLVRRATSDARLAYRAGSERFATLYVAEGAALAAQERRIDVRAAIANAAIALFGAQGYDWQEADLEPPAAGKLRMTGGGDICGQP